MPGDRYNFTSYYTHDLIEMKLELHYEYDTTILGQLSICKYYMYIHNIKCNLVVQ